MDLHPPLIVLIRSNNAIKSVLLELLLPFAACRIAICLLVASNMFCLLFQIILVLKWSGNKFTFLKKLVERKHHSTLQHNTLHWIYRWVAPAHIWLMQPFCCLGVQNSKVDLNGGNPKSAKCYCTQRQQLIKRAHKEKTKNKQKKTSFIRDNPWLIIGGAICWRRRGKQTN